MSRRLSRKPSYSARRAEPSGELLTDARALTVLAKELRSNNYDHALFSGWVSIDALRSGKRPARNFVAAIESALTRGVRVSFVIGGITTDEALNGFLLELRSVLARGSLRAHFDAGYLVFATDNRAPRRIHAKAWAFLKGSTCERLYVGSFNLSSGAFFQNLEAATATRPSPVLTKELVDEATRGRITPRQFSGVENKLQRPPKSKQEDEASKKYAYLKRVKSTPTPPTGSGPTPRSPPPADVSDLWVVLKDPSRGERSGYRIPEPLLAALFGEKFLAREQNETGIIEPPRVLIVPFRRDMAKAFEKQRNGLSQTIVRQARATSVGYVLDGERREHLTLALAEQAAKSDALRDRMKAFVEDDGFSRFLRGQVVEQILRLRNRYAAQVELAPAAVSVAAKPFHRKIIGDAREAASRILERLAREKEVSFLPLEVVLDFVEGVDRQEVLQELGIGT